MKKIFLSTVFLVSITTFSFAQYLDYEIIGVMDYYETNQMITDQANNVLTEESIDGSPYLNDEFVAGTVYTTKKTKIVDVPLRYNIYNDNLEFKTPTNQVFALAEPETIELAEFGNIKMIFCEYINANRTKSGFFKIVEKGKITLLAKPDIQYQKPTEEAAFKEAQPAKFIEKPDNYYLQTNNKPANKVGTKKNLISLLDDHQKEVSAFIKKHNTKLTKSEDLQKLIQYYNSL